MKKLICILLTLILAFSVSSCHYQRLNEGEEIEEQILTVSDPSYYEKFHGKDISINVYNWGEYISDGSDGLLDVNSEFTNLTGIKVNYSTYATNEELYAKLKGGGTNYDIIIPSDYMIARMVKEGMLEKLDFNNIPNFENIMEKFRGNIYDPQEE